MSQASSSRSFARWKTAIREHRFDVLLLSLLLLMASAPVVHALWPTGRLLAAHLSMLALFALMLLSAVLAACQRRREVIIALWLAVPGFLFDAAGLLGNHVGLATLGHLFETCFLGYTAALILRMVFAAERVTLNMVWASACVYLLLGVLFANVYSLMDVIHPGSFYFTFAGDAEQEAMRLGGGQSVYPLYYSFVTITTLGYGDIVPITGPTRMLATVEALTGQLYLAVLVARLVGMHISQAASSRPGGLPGRDHKQEDSGHGD